MTSGKLANKSIKEAYPKYARARRSDLYQGTVPTINTMSNKLNDEARRNDPVKTAYAIAKQKTDQQKSGGSYNNNNSYGADVGAGLEAGGGNEDDTIEPGGGDFTNNNNNDDDIVVNSREATIEPIEPLWPVQPREAPRHLDISASVESRNIIANSNKRQR
ncbi:hypothetical protein E8E12_003665 [Didymella heteroderae]|uniref:Uncharacterized protein n=1 Tax=Didymella heteroderae TaxID=1769908 RepID=A0A9P4WVM7_9PLEO|nr:hypothetical protein E8E12_003665 [Didymella heteroderae]